MIVVRAISDKQFFLLWLAEASRPVKAFSLLYLKHITSIYLRQLQLKVAQAGR